MTGVASWLLEIELETLIIAIEHPHKLPRTCQMKTVAGGLASLFQWEREHHLSAHVTTRATPSAAAAEAALITSRRESAHPVAILMPACAPTAGQRRPISRGPRELAACPISSIALPSSRRSTHRRSKFFGIIHIYSPLVRGLSSSTSGGSTGSSPVLANKLMFPIFLRLVLSSLFFFGRRSSFFGSAVAVRASNFF